MSLDFKGLAGVAEATGLSNAAGNSMGIDGIFPSLSMKQRVIGFAVCFSVGLIISCMSSLSLYSLNMTQFAIFYTLGNVIALFRCAFGSKSVDTAVRAGATGRQAATLRAAQRRARWRLCVELDAHDGHTAAPMASGRSLRPLLANPLLPLPHPPVQHVVPVRPPAAAEEYVCIEALGRDAAVPRDADRHARRRVHGEQEREGGGWGGRGQGR